MGKRKTNPEDDVALLSTGDVNALEYGGGILYFQPEYNEFLWVFWDGPDDDDEEELEAYTYRVYMFRYAPEEDLFSSPHGGLDWAEKDLDSIASTVGMTGSELRQLGRAPPLEKWNAAEVVKAHWGSENLDHSPFEQSHAEMEKRYGDDLDKVARRSFDEAKKVYDKARKGRDSNPDVRQLKNKLLR